MLKQLVKGSTLPIQRIKITGYEGDLSGMTVTGTIREEQQIESRNIKGSLSIDEGNIVEWHPDAEDVGVEGINYLQLKFSEGSRHLFTMITKLEILPVQ